MKTVIVIITVILSNLILLAQESTQGKFSAQVFGDFFYNAERDTSITSMPNIATGGKKDLFGVQIRRIFFTYDYEISSTFSSRFRLEAEQSTNAVNGKMGVFVKDAYLKWKDIILGQDLFFGVQPTPAWEVSELFWGNRNIEKTIMDLRGISSQRDLGISLRGKFDEGGQFKYWIMFGNNVGNKTEIDKYKRYYSHIQYSPIKNFSLTFYFDYKTQPKMNNPSSSATPKAILNNNVLTYALFVGYSVKDYYSIGFEGFINSTQNGITLSNKSTKTKNGFGFTVYSSLNILKELAIVGRYDFYDPNADPDYKGDKRNFFVASVNYKPNDNVTISPNVLIESYQNLLTPVSRKFITSVTPRVTVYFLF